MNTATAPRPTPLDHLAPASGDAPAKRRRVTLDEVRQQGTVPVWPHAADVLGIGRSTAYSLAEAGTLPTIRLGRRLVVPVPALLRMLGDDAA